MNPHAVDGTDLVMPQLIVPAYFHPATHPGQWAWLARHAAEIRMIVLNLASGPGPQPDEAFYPVLDQLHAAGVTVGGYVDTNYGQRPVYQAMTDLGRYVDWYQVSGVFFDRVAAAADQAGQYADLARNARDMGAHVVAFNHGAHPAEAYAEHADLLGTFEGPWNSYLELAVPALGQVTGSRAVLPPPALGAARLLQRRRLARRPPQRRLRLHHRPRRNQPLGPPPRWLT